MGDTTARHHRFAIAAAVVLAVLTACNDGGGSSTTPTTTTTTASVPGSVPAGPTTSVTVITPPDGDGGIDTMEGADTSPKSGAAATAGTALLSAVRAARHEGYDRVVFEFRNGVPGWDVRYVDEPVLSDGAGEVVPVVGDHVLGVRMEPASGVDLTAPDAPETYTGPRRFTPATAEVAEVVQAGDFEAVLTWAIGVRDRVDFRAFTLSSPPRLVIDVRNH